MASLVSLLSEPILRTTKAESIRSNEIDLKLYGNLVRGRSRKGDGNGRLRLCRALTNNIYADFSSPFVPRNEFDNTAYFSDGSDDEFDIPCQVAVPNCKRWWASTQDENALRFRMDMPGLAREDVKVYVDNLKLVVRGKYGGKKIFAELEDDEANSILDNEGIYSAEWYLPDNVQVDKIKSQMKDGVLLVTAPKEVTNVLVE